MSDLEIFLKSTVLYANLDEISNLQQCEHPIKSVTDQINSVISSLTSDLLLRVVDELVDPLVQGCIKHQETAEEHKKSGNKAFSSKQYNKAITEFSHALRFVDTANAAHVDLSAKLHCNRSLALSKLKQHTMALNDCTMSIKLDSSYAKAYYRRALCHQALENTNSARKDAQMALKLIKEQGGHQQTEEIESLIKMLNKKSTDSDGNPYTCREIDAHTNTATTSAIDWTTYNVPSALHNIDARNNNNNNNNDDNTQHEVDPPNAYLHNHHNNKTNAFFVNSHSTLGILQDHHKGRYLAVVPSKDNNNNDDDSKEHNDNSDNNNNISMAIPAGTDIFKEPNPFAYVLSKHQRLKRCATCCKALPLNGSFFYSCPSCAMILLCSEECRQNQHFHEPGGSECGIPLMAVLPPAISLAIRVARRLKSTSTSLEYNVVSSLETHFSELPAGDAVHYAALAVAVHAAWQRAVLLERSCEVDTAQHESVHITAEDVLRAICIVNINAIAIVPGETACGDDAIGLALYPMASFLTHACVPNVSLRFEGNAVTVRSLQSISPPSPLFHCYGPQVGEMTTLQRRAMLLHQYHFHCNCQFCVSPRDSEFDMVGLKCSTVHCKGSRAVQCNADAGLLSKYDIFTMNSDDNKGGCCRYCGAVISEIEYKTSVLPQLQKALDLYESGCKMLAQDGENSREMVVGGLSKLKESLSIRQELLHKNNQVVGATHNALSWGFEVFGDINRAEKHCRMSVEVAEKVYPENSTNVAFQQIKLGRLALSCKGKNGDGDELMKRALGVLEVHFEKDYVNTLLQHDRV